MRKISFILLVFLAVPAICHADGTLAPGELNALLDEIKASEVTAQTPEKATVIRAREKGGAEKDDGHPLPSFMQENEEPAPAAASGEPAGASSSPASGRDGNGAVSEVHDGLSDVTAADLARSQGHSQDLPTSKWQAGVRAELGYDPGRPPSA